MDGYSYLDIWFFTFLKSLNFSLVNLAVLKYYGHKFFLGFFCKEIELLAFFLFLFCAARKKSALVVQILQAAPSIRAGSGEVAAY